MDHEERVVVALQAKVFIRLLSCFLYHIRETGKGVIHMSKKVLILADNIYDERELWYPAIRMKEEGFKVLFVGSGRSRTYTSKLGMPVTVDHSADELDFDFDALIIPGGYAPDQLRRYPAVLELVRKAFKENKVVAAVCHAAWVLVSAGVLEGKTMTCVSAIRDDVVNAGARYVDEPVVIDGNLITSRTPADLHLFGKAIVDALAKK